MVCPTIRSLVQKIIDLKKDYDFTNETLILCPKITQNLEMHLLFITYSFEEGL